jgi:hypothetical protein
MVAPITVKAATKAVRLWHRHLKRVTGGLWAVSVVDESDTLRGVAIVGRPARLAQDGWTCEVIRCATDGTKAKNFNACSLLYSTCRRIAQLMGFRRCLTKTLPEEGGASLRALGLEPIGLTRGGEWSRPSRSRAKAERPEPKTQWNLFSTKETST